MCLSNTLIDTNIHPSKYIGRTNITNKIIIIVFKYIKIEDFLEIQSLLRQRHLIVNYFDVDLGERVTHEMAITGNERKKIYSMRNYINGVQELKIKMVATNRDDRVLQRKITYHKNFGDDINEVYEEDLFNIGEQATFRNCTLARTGYYFVKWNTKADGSGVDYIPSTSLTIYQNYSLFAIWQPTGE